MSAHAESLQPIEPACSTLSPVTGTSKPFRIRGQVELLEAGQSGILRQADLWELALYKYVDKGGTWLCRLVMSKLADQQGWAKAGGWAFDGRKNIYTPSEWLPPHEVLHTVRPSLLSSCLPACLPPSLDCRPCMAACLSFCLTSNKWYPARLLTCSNAWSAVSLIMRLQCTAVVLPE